MKPSEQRLSEARRQHTEAIVARHVHELFQRLPRRSAAVDEETVDRIIRAESDHARFVAGLVVWQRGELRQEIERGAWYVLPPDAHLALRKPSEGLWEEPVRLSQLRANSI